MTDVMREMIAQLMGAQREEEEGRKLPPYYSRQVCRLYLIGCCPKDKLTDTRLEPFITCRKMHEPAHKADYERAQEKQDHYYDVEVRFSQFLCTYMKTRVSLGFRGDRGNYQSY